MKIFLAIMIVVSLITLSSCGDDRDVKVYRLPKEQTEAGKEHDLEQNIREEITWDTPAEWREQPASGIRAGSFLAVGDDGVKVDISIIFLEGPAGGDLANVNRWRSQISLPSWTNEEFMQNLTVQDSPIGEFKIVDLTNETSRIVAAILPFNHGTWFFKMTGDKNLIDVHKPIFSSFLESVNFVDY